MYYKQIKYFIITIFLIGITPIFYFGGQYQAELNSIQFQRQNAAKHQLNFSQKEINSIASVLGTSLQLLSDNRVLIQFIEDPSVKNRSLLESLWSLTATNYSYISQVRFIGVDGKEISRINDDNNEITIVPIDQLQDKSQRDYFIYAQSLKPDDLGFFGIDLEVEHGKVLTPAKPSLRIFTPVEVDDERKGYLFFNLDVYEIVAQVGSSLEPGYQIEFVNEEGYYLASQDKRKTLGHIIAERDSYNILIETPGLWTESEVLGQPPSIFQSGNHNKNFYSTMWKAIQTDGIWQGEVTNKRKNGELLTEILRIQAIVDKHGEMKYFIASFVDITARKELENRLRELSEKDVLTQCWNRRKFEAEFSNIIGSGPFTKEMEPSCLAIVDIDHFKRINDTYGHDIGDKVITEVGRILDVESRRADFVARIGGEEFAIILPNTQLNEAEVILNRLRVAITLNDDIKVTISGGITDICCSSEASYKRADLALYDSKTSGRNKMSCFSSAEMEQIT